MRALKTIETILFVEDDPVVLTMYRTALEREGFRVETAQDGLVALKSLSERTPDLVVLDLLLPKLNGGDVIKFIRAEPRLKSIPIIVLSNTYKIESGQDALLAGANRRLLKSDCTPAVLQQVIQELLTAGPAEDRPASATQPEAAPAPGLQMAGNGQESKRGVSTAAAANEAPSPEGRAEFLKHAPAEIAKIREHCLAYIKSPASAASLQHFSKLCQRVDSLRASAGAAGCARLAMLMNAFHALLAEITAKPSWVTPSILQTVAQAADCLSLLLKNDELAPTELNFKGKVLVMDDDPVCNRVVVTTLKRANFEAVSVEDPQAGLELLQTAHYDLVLLDVNMPNLNGFEVCEKLRTLPHCETMPVIFVTAYSNFENRTQGVLSGGDDFITKPVAPLELALKVTIHLLKSRVQRAGKPQPKPRLDQAEVSEDVFQRATAAQSDPAATPEAMSTVPSSALLPATESRTGDAQSAEAASIALPITELSVADDAEDVFQRVAASQINPIETRETDTVSSDVLQSITASGTGDPESVGSSSGATDLPEAALQPAALAYIHQPEAGEAESAAPSGALLPATESATADVPEEVFQSDLPQNLAAASVSRGGTGSSNRTQNEFVKNEPTETFDQIVLGAARVLFGDEAVTEMNLRLLHIAFDFMKNEPNPTFDRIVLEVARIIFGDEKLTEMNLRLVRIALERYNVDKLVNGPAEARHA